MLFLIAIVIAVLFSWFCAEPLRKHPVPFYIGGTVITAVMIVLGLSHVHASEFVNNYVIGLFNKGALAAALWCVVAWIGALPDEAKEMKKRLLPSRGELSIFAAVMTVSHAVNYGVTYIKRLTSGRTGTADFIATCIICLILMLIMIPLTVISFKTIRKKIKGKTWKNIQRAAYVFYALIYAHVMVIYIPRAQQGRDGALFSVLMYTLVFVGYAVLRIRKAFIKVKKPESKGALNAICAAVFILVTGGFGLASRASAAPAQSAEANNTATTPVTAETQVLTEEASTEEIPTEVRGEVSSEAETQAETKSDDTTETSGNDETTETADNSESAETAANTEKTQVTDKASETVSASTTTADSGTASTEAAAQATEAEQQPEANQNEPADETIPADDNIAQENNTPEENNDAPAEEVVNEPEVTEPVTEPEPEPEPEPETDPPAPETIYHDGTFSATKFGYDSDVYVTITIQNDIITDITATCDESDMYYFEVAFPVLKQAILAAQSPDVDAVSGSTYSSDAIRDGVREALASARK